MAKSKWKIKHWELMEIISSIKNWNIDCPFRKELCAKIEAHRKNTKNINKNGD